MPKRSESEKQINNNKPEQKQLVNSLNITHPLNYSKLFEALVFWQDKHKELGWWKWSKDRKRLMFLRKRISKPFFQNFWELLWMKDICCHWKFCVEIDWYVMNTRVICKISLNYNYFLKESTSLVHLNSNWAKCQQIWSFLELWCF